MCTSPISAANHHSCFTPSWFWNFFFIPFVFTDLKYSHSHWYTAYICSLSWLSGIQWLCKSLMQQQILPQVKHEPWAESVKVPNLGESLSFIGNCKEASTELASRSLKTAYGKRLPKTMCCVSILIVNKQCEWNATYRFNYKKRVFSHISIRPKKKVHTLESCGLLLNLYCLQTKMLHTKNCWSRISLGKTKTLEVFEKKSRFLPLSFWHPAENRDFAQKTSKQKREVETSRRIETPLTSLLWNGFVTEPLFSLKSLNLGC